MLHNFEVISDINYQYNLARQLFTECKKYPGTMMMTAAVPVYVAYVIVIHVAGITEGVGATAISIVLAPILIPNLFYGVFRGKIKAFYENVGIFMNKIVRSVAFYATVVPTVVIEGIKVIKYHKEFFIHQDEEYTALMKKEVKPKGRFGRKQ